MDTKGYTLTLDSGVREQLFIILRQFQKAVSHGECSKLSNTIKKFLKLFSIKKIYQLNVCKKREKYI